MIITYIKGKYRLNAKSSDAKELIRELTLALKMLAQDASISSDEDSQGIIRDIVLDLEDSGIASSYAPIN